MQACRRYIVTGAVQGVGFRYHTQKQAIRLGLTGWVRNLASGEVELVACGATACLDQLFGWLQQGPGMARVRAVHSQEVDERQEFSSFTIR